VEQKPIVELARTNLADIFSLNPNLSTGTDLNNVIKEGPHTGVANGAYVNKPAELSEASAFTIEAIPLFAGGNRWFIQKLTILNEPHKQIRLELVQLHGSQPQIYR
jgi:hypothetical protein